MSKSTKKAIGVVSDNQKWVNERIQGWQDHADHVYDLYSRILDDAQEPISGGEFIREAVGLGLNFWDTAYGWMYDSKK